MRLLSVAACAGILLTTSVVWAGSGGSGKGPDAPAARKGDAAPDRAAATPSASAPASASVPQASAPASGDPPATAPTTTGETLEEIVARVRRRLASESARTRRQAPVRPPAPPREPPRERVTLVWRPSVVWPAQLTDAVVGSPDPARVSLSWETEGP